MKKNVFLLLTVAFCMTILLAACSNKPEGNTKQEVKKFRIGFLPSPDDLLYYVAVEKGYFKQEGLDVELFQFTNSGEGLNAIKAGKLDVGAFGTAAPLAFIAKGAEFTMIGGANSGGAALVAKPGNVDQFKEFKNYKGKAIATVRLATGDVVFRGALTDAGIDWKNEMTIQEMESPAAVLEAVKKGSVDAGIVWTPFIAMSKRQGLKVAMYSTDFYKDHACCRQTILTSDLDKKRDDYKKLLRALIKAYNFYQENHDETIDIIAKYVKVDKDILKEETYGDHMYTSPDPDKKAVIKYWDYMNKTGFIKSDIKIEDHIYTDLYKNALDEVIKENPDNVVYKKLEADFIRCN